MHDQLTGLPTAVLLIDRLQQALAHAMRRKQQLAVVYLDIDRFRNINERNGMAAGNTILREMAVRLRRCVLRKEDTVARLCGDQFVIVLGDIDGDQGTQNVLNRIGDALQPKFRFAGQELAVSVSMGASLYPEDGDEWSPLLRCSSLLMRQAKLAGGNSYVYCGDAAGVDVKQDSKYWGHDFQVTPADVKTNIREQTYLWGR